jgi:hypothetical protein
MAPLPGCTSRPVTTILFAAMCSSLARGDFVSSLAVDGGWESFAG